MKKSLINLRVVAAVVFLLILLGSIFSYRYFFSQASNTGCYRIANDDALAMIGRIFDRKLERSKTGRILMDLNPKNLVVAKITRNNGVRGDGFFSVDIDFSDGSTGKSVLTAVVYEDCDVQWISKPN